jgi:large subunit ribosomal protein L6
MSRIGKQPVKVPSGVKVEVKDRCVTIASGAVSLTLHVAAAVDVQYDAAAGALRVTRQSDDRPVRALHGTTRALLANMVHGVTQGFHKDMALYGTGYSVKQEGQNLIVAVGFAKPVTTPIPPGVKVEIKAPTTRGNEVPALFTVRGADKHMVGQFAASLRMIRPPEPYKGKGIRYATEVVKRKMGKAFASGG